MSSVIDKHIFIAQYMLSVKLEQIVHCYCWLVSRKTERERINGQSVTHFRVQTLRRFWHTSRCLRTFLLCNPGCLHGPKPSATVIARRHMYNCRIFDPYLNRSGHGVNRPEEKLCWLWPVNRRSQEGSIRTPRLPSMSSGSKWMCVVITSWLITVWHSFRFPSCLITIVGA